MPPDLLQYVAIIILSGCHHTCHRNAVSRAADVRDRAKAPDPLARNAPYHGSYALGNVTLAYQKFPGINTD